eukprot:3021628-Prorocentrum_lima.AAC.1
MGPGSPVWTPIYWTGSCPTIAALIGRAANASAELDALAPPRQHLSLRAGWVNGDEPCREATLARDMCRKCGVT